MKMLERIKSYMMPISMIIGIIFYKYLSLLAPITPALIFVMLFISYCNLSLKDIFVRKLHILLLSIQLFGSLGIYWLLSYYDPTVAQGTMICILAPTATSAIVITGMLGGRMESLASFSLLSNFMVVVTAPIIFVCIGYRGDVSFGSSLFIIFTKVFSILLLPFILNLIMKMLLPKVYHVVRKGQGVSFYLWSFALMIVTANTLKFILVQSSSNYKIEIIMGILALVVCVFQFYIGRTIGRKYGDTIAGGQGLGQKNTILAIWMAQTYFNPVSSIAPGAYVLWQNVVNSYQVWKRKSGHDLN